MKAFATGARATDERHRALFESVPLPIMLYDVDTLAFIAVNDATVARYGWSRGELAHMTVRDVRPPEEVASAVALIRSLPADGFPLVRGIHRRRDRTDFHVEITSHVFAICGTRARLALIADAASDVPAPEGGTAWEGLLRRVVSAREDELARERASAALDGAMDRYADGCDAAFAELHRGLAPRVRGFLLRLSASPALADELAQEAFLRIHCARGSFAKGGHVVPWALAIARNVFIDQTRRARVRAPMHGRAARSMEEELPADPGARPDEALAARESANAVGAALARLPMKQREAFILMRFEGLGFREAAQVAGATESAIRVRAFRAYEALRAALATQV